MDQQQNESRTSNWRNERYMKMLESGNGADIYFLVGKMGEKKQRIPAHKSVLSNVFEGQFLRHIKITGTQEEGSKEKPIEVLDISQDAFRAFLKFAYVEDFSSVSKQNVLDVYYAGQKYMIDAVVDQCRQWLMNGQNLGVDNVLSVLKLAQLYEDKSLIEYCWSFVDKNAKCVLESKEFFELNQADLCELFGRDSLEADEFFLFCKLNHWTVNKCEANGLEKTSKNFEKVIGNAIYKIRFPLFTHQQFTKFIVPANMLIKEDIIAMYIHYSSKKFGPDEDEVDNAAKLEHYVSVIAETDESDYENRFNCQPRASKFRIIIDKEEAKD